MSVAGFHPTPTMRPITVGAALRGLPQASAITMPPFNDAYARLWPRVPVGGSAVDVVGKGYNNCLKLDPRKPSNTLPKTQTGRGFATICHWQHMRAITIEEARRLGSFPDAFTFTGDYSTQWQRIGNSVPPRFMYEIASHVRSHLLHLPSPDPEDTMPGIPLDFIHAPINPTSPRLFNVITTFAGCGGSSLGYKWAGGKILAAVEWDENAVATYRANHHGTPVLHRDIATVTAEELLKLTGLAKGELDVFDGSPPCQGFSTAGKRQLDDPRNSLFREYVRLLRGLQPKVFIMENVSGMVKGHMKHVFAIVMRELKASGYTVKCQLMDAAYFGVPQHRQRVIFIGVRNDLMMEPSHPKPLASTISVERALDGVTPEYFRAPHAGQMWAVRLAKPGETLSKYHPRGYWFSYLRLPRVRPAPTLQKSQADKCYHFRDDRVITVREAARIASFPDAFTFIGKHEDGWERIGNTVPPRFMQAIAEHVYARILAPIAAAA